MFSNSVTSNLSRQSGVMNRSMDMDIFVHYSAELERISDFTFTMRFGISSGLGRHDVR